MADKMAQWVNMSAAKPESLSSNPRTHMVRENWFTTRAAACIGGFTHAFVRA